MTNQLASMPDHKTPPDVEIRFAPRKPVTDPTLGIAVNVSRIQKESDIRVFSDRDITTKRTEV